MRTALLLAGPSAVGKTTVMKLITEKASDFELIRSITTRSPRGDGHDSEYIYMSKSDFFKTVENGDVLEYTEFGGNFYGTPKSELDRVFEEAKIPILILDLNGIVTVKGASLDFDTFSVYIYDNINVMERRLYERQLAKEPSASALEVFMRRKNENIRDYLRLPTVAECFDAFLQNKESEKTAEDILTAYKKYKAGEIFSIEDTAAIAAALAESAKEK